jgi:hypothetical protein
MSNIFGEDFNLLRKLGKENVEILSHVSNKKIVEIILYPYF